MFAMLTHTNYSSNFSHVSSLWRSFSRTNLYKFTVFDITSKRLYFKYKKIALVCILKREHRKSNFSPIFYVLDFYFKGKTFQVLSCYSNKTVRFWNKFWQTYSRKWKIITSRITAQSWVFRTLMVNLKNYKFQCFCYNYKTVGRKSTIFANVCTSTRQVTQSVL